jgi:hypothetical protein
MLIGGGLNEFLICTYCQRKLETEEQQIKYSNFTTTINRCKSEAVAFGF